ncbi:MAG: acetyl-CoA decarbonylase/synthase complex subunit gamma, partial [Chloroflexi bacterium]|nr:acetyl-CoA decarbonylase/synthase complex subunit gamma [Chloroflexota bacterium]
MALSGIEIYKLLPKTNCKDCEFPTCLAFAMKLATKQVELSACPHVSEESQSLLAASSEPPIRLVSLKSDGYEVKAGNEVVLFRHEKTFYNMPGLFIRVTDEMTSEQIQKKLKPAEEYLVNYVGIDLAVDGYAIESTSNDPTKFKSAVESVRSVSKKPIVLICKDPKVIRAGLDVLEGESPLIYAADESNWEEMGEIAKNANAPLVVSSPNIDSIAEITEKLKDFGVLNLVLDPANRDLSTSLMQFTQ